MKLLFMICLCISNSYCQIHSNQNTLIPPKPVGGLEGLQSKIEYPILARKAGLQTSYLIEVTIDTNGSIDKLEYKLLWYPGNPSIRDTLFFKELGQKIKETKWEPAQYGGKPIISKFVFPIVLYLTNESDTDISVYKKSGRILKFYNNPIVIKKDKFDLAP